MNTNKPLNTAELTSKLTKLLENSVLNGQLNLKDLENTHQMSSPNAIIPEGLTQKLSQILQKGIKSGTITLDDVQNLTQVTDNNVTTNEIKTVIVEPNEKSTIEEHIDTVFSNEPNDEQINPPLVSNVTINEELVTDTPKEMETKVINIETKNTTPVVSPIAKLPITHTYPWSDIYQEVCTTMPPDDLVDFVALERKCRKEKQVQINQDSNSQKMHTVTEAEWKAKNDEITFLKNKLTLQDDVLIYPIITQKILAHHAKLSPIETKRKVTFGILRWLTQRAKVVKYLEDLGQLPVIQEQLKQILLVDKQQLVKRIDEIIFV